MSASLSIPTMTVDQDDEWFDKLEHGVTSWMESDSDSGGLMSNARLAILYFVFICCMAVYNLVFTTHVAFFTMGGVHAQEATLPWINKKTAQLEWSVLMFYVIRLLFNVLAACARSDEQCVPHLIRISDNLRVIGGFSFFWFLPVPAKLMYWFSVRRILWREIVHRPVALQLRRVASEDPGPASFTPFSRRAVKHLWSKEFEGYGADGKVMLISIMLLAWFVVRIAIPCSLPLLVLASPIAVYSKLSAMPRLNSFSEVTGRACFSCVAVMLQLSRMWDIDEIEFLAVLQFVTCTTHGPDEVANLAESRQLVPAAIVQACGKTRGLFIISALNSTTSAQIFRLAFDDESHEAVGRIFHRVWASSAFENDSDSSSRSEGCDLA